MQFRDTTFARMCQFSWLGIKPDCEPSYDNDAAILTAKLYNKMSGASAELRGYSNVLKR